MRGVRGHRGKSPGQSWSQRGLLGLNHQRGHSADAEQFCPDCPMYGEVRGRSLEDNSMAGEGGPPTEGDL
jgi:hypothetical protein